MLCEVTGCTQAAVFPKIDGQPHAIKARWCARHATERYPGGRMTKWTKEDIDGLVAKMKRVPGSKETLFDYYSTSSDGSYCARLEVKSWDVARALYLAAGLTETGERKPEKVRCWLGTRQDGERIIFLSEREAVVWHRDSGYVPTPGTFVPDVAE